MANLMERTMPADDVHKQPRGRWRKGQSGNPRGRRAGSRNNATLLAEQLMAADLAAVVQSVIAAARAGDVRAAALIVERLVPRRRGRPVELDLPPVAAAQDVPTALAAVLRGVAAGELTPEEGLAVAGVIDRQRQALELTEIERRLAALEETR